MTGSARQGWRQVGLGNLLDFKNGLNKGKAAFGHGTPIVNFMDVLDNVLLKREQVRGRVALTPSERRRFSARAGDVFFTRTSESVDEVGTSTVLIESIPDAVFSGFVLRGRPRREEVDPVFLAYALRTYKVRKQIVRSASYTTRALTNGRALGRVVLAVPSAAEQRRIGSALLDADEAIAALARLAAKREAIARGSAQALLAGEPRLPGFDRPWEEVRLGEVLEVRHGRSQRHVASEGGRFPILASGGEIGRTDTPLYSRPSVLIGRKGTIDRPLYMDSPFWTVDTLFYTEVGPGVEPKFLYYACRAIDWRSMNEASGVPSLSSRRIESVRVSLPPLEEQRAIVEVLDTAERETELLRARLAKRKDIREAMMQELFGTQTTGPVEEPAAA